MSKLNDLECFVEAHLDKSWDFSALCRNALMTWAFWSEHQELIEVSIFANPSIPYETLETMLPRFSTDTAEERLVWFWLCRNSNVPWSVFEERIAKEQYLNKTSISMNPSIPRAFIERYAHHLDWAELCRNPGVPFDFLELYMDKVDWNWLSIAMHPGITEAFYHRYRHRIPDAYFVHNPKSVEFGVAPVCTHPRCSCPTKDEFGKPLPPCKHPRCKCPVSYMKVGRFAILANPAYKLTKDDYHGWAGDGEPRLHIAFWQHICRHPGVDLAFIHEFSRVKSSYKPMVMRNETLEEAKARDAKTPGTLKKATPDSAYPNIVWYEDEFVEYHKTDEKGIFLLEQDFVHWDKLCMLGRPGLLEWLKDHEDKIYWRTLSMNNGCV